MALTQEQISIAALTFKLANLAVRGVQPVREGSEEGQDEHA